MKLSTCLAMMAVFGATVTVCADTYTWTGAENGFWTNVNNWAEGTVPGRYYDASKTLVGQVGDIAVFGDGLTGNAVKTIDFDGVYSVRQILTEGTNLYTYGTAEAQYVPIEPYGVFSAAETSATPAALISARLKLGVELMATNWGGEKMTVRNNSTREFVLGKWGYNTPSAARGSGGEPGVVFAGSGNIRLSQPYQWGTWGMMMNVGMTGKLIVDVQTSVRQISINSVSGVSGPQEIEITANGSLEPYSCYNYLTVGRSTVISGEGPFRFGAGVRGKVGVVCESSLWSPVTFKCPVETKFIGGEPPESYPQRVYINGGSNGNTMTFSGGCTMKGVIRADVTVSVASDSLGLRGTYGGMGDVDFLLGADATLRYTGPGETTDRAIVLTNKTANADGYAQIDHAGTGPFIVNSSIELAGGREAGHVTFKGATLAPATYSGTIDNRLVVYKSGTGDWTFSPQNDFTGTISVSGGTLGFGKSLHLSSLRSSSGTTIIRVPDGCMLEVDALTTASDKKLDIQLLGADASFKVVGGTAGSSLPGVTLNGHSAVLDEDLKLVMVVGNDNLWKTAVSGDWTDAAKWVSNAAPDVSQPTYIDALGGDYTVTLDGDEITTTNLIVRNIGSGTATLLVTNGASMTVRGHTTKAPVLTLGQNGRIEVVDSTFRLLDQGNAEGDISGISSVSLDRGEISVRGSSSFITYGIPLSGRTSTKTDNLNTHFTFGTGTLSFNDTAQFKTGYETVKTVFYHNLMPTRAGETSRMVFRGSSRIAAPSAPWTLGLYGNGGRSVLEIDTDYSGEMTGWNCNHISAWSGTGELLIKRGHFSTGGWDYFWVATPTTDAATGSTLFSTGVVEVASGASLKTVCGSPSLTQFNGVMFGHGTALMSGRGTSHVYGRMDLAGTYTQERGHLFLGSGPDAVGEVLQTAGTALIVPDTTKEAANTKGEVVVGLFGGTGRYVLEDGVVTTGHNVYLGGAFTNDLFRTHKNSPVLDRYHDAKGTLSISGGSFTSAKNIILGRDGTGVINLSGTGTVAAASIIVSNTVGQAASGLTFTADAAANCGRIDPATKLVFLPGAKVTVDVTAQATAASPRRVVVWNLDEAPEGVADLDLTLVGADGLRVPNSLDLSPDGKVLAWNISRATVMVFR